MRRIPPHSFIVLAVGNVLILLFFIFFTPKAFADEFADENLYAPALIWEFEAFTIHYTEFSKDACYVFELYDQDRAKFIQSQGGLGSPCYNGSNIYGSSKSLGSDGDILIKALSAGKYSLSLFKQECRLFEWSWSCSLAIKRTINFNVTSRPTPIISPPPGTGVCNLGYQSPTLDSNCAGCVISNFNNFPPASDLISSIRETDPSFYASCSDNQIINFWCNGGKGQVAKDNCGLIKNGPCSLLCGLSVVSPPAPTPILPTIKEACNSEGKQCDTALGPISTDPTDFVKSIFGIILSLSGGIALLLIIFSGYRLLTSQGNPEKVQGAKETLTSAIVGLLFILFSMVILQVIGVDILKIPGFSR